MSTKFQLRRGTAAQWTTANPTLAAGEPGFETDTGKFKIGDGTTAWNSLAYQGGGGGVTFGTPAIALGTTAAAGSISEAIKRDATIVAFDATAPSTQAFGDSAAAGSAAVAARRDHKHAMPATPTTVSGNAGTATALQTARAIDGQNFDGTAAITVIAPGTHAATTKATPVDADELPLVDSAASNVLKKLTWANLKATLKTYFDTLYSATGAYAPGGTDVAVTDGGTGASTAATARTNLGIPGAVGGIEWTTVAKAGDTSVSSNITIAADPELTFASASGVYEIEAFIIYGSPAGAGTPDLRITLAEDGTSRAIVWGWGFSTTDTNLATSAIANTANFMTFGTAAANRGLLIKSAYVSAGGTVAIYWAQNTSGTNATILRTGSVLRYRKIA